jgi:RimJ/RimL family protein N-acetyltransferase
MSRSSKATASIHLEPWGPGDLLLLTRLVGDPVMMEHLGGPESPEKIAERHARYVGGDPNVGLMYKIVDDVSGKGVGNVGYWPRSWRGMDVFETGWMVLPEFHGRGIAGAATAQLIDIVRSLKTRRYLHAFPSVDNAPSNAICRKVGFTLLEALDFEYPPGHFMRCNDWRLDLAEPVAS